MGRIFDLSSTAGESTGTPMNPNVKVTLAGVALDVTKWEWPIFRGSDPMPVIVPIGGGKLPSAITELKAGPHELEITAPEERGVQEGVKTTIKGVWFDYAERTTLQGGYLRLYDNRFALRGKVWPFDLNSVRPINPEKKEITDPPEKRYRPDTARSETSPATLRYALDKIAQTIAPITILYDTASEPDRELPDGLSIGGILRVNEAIDYLCSLVGHEMTVDIDGQIVILKQADERTLTNWRSYKWHVAPTADAVSRWVPGAPKKIEMLVQKRYELELVIVGTSGSSVAKAFPSGTQALRLRNVYEWGGNYLTAQELIDEYYATADAYGLGDVRLNGRTISTTAEFEFDRHITDDEWLGTVFRTRPLQATTPAGGERDDAAACILAQSFIEVVKRDHRKLFRIEKEGDAGNIEFDAWYDYDFAVMDEKGQPTDYTERAGSRIGTCCGDWCDLLTQMISYRRVNGAGVEADLARNNREPGGQEQVAPFMVRWDRDPGSMVIRLEPLAPQGASPVVGLVANRFPGFWSTLPGIRQQTPEDLIQATEYSSADTRILVSGAKGQLDPRIEFRVRVVATQRTPNTRERFHIVSVDTNIEGAERESMEVPSTPDVSLAVLMDGTELNGDLVRSDAQAQADRIIAAYKAGANGVGIAHGCRVARDLRHPYGSIQKITLLFGMGPWRYFIGTQLDYGPPAYDTMLADARYKALVAQRAKITAGEKKTEQSKRVEEAERVVL